MIPQIALFTALALQVSSFEVASVRINEAGTAGGEGRERESIQVSPGSLTMRNITLDSCLQWAYGLRSFQIAGAPDWFTSERYDIFGKAPGPVAETELKIMLQSLLADRFRLKIRHESRDLPVYWLKAAKGGLKIAPAADAVAPASMHPVDGALVFQNVSMAEFADRLSKRPFSLDRPVMDQTRANGIFSFSLKLADNADELKHGLEKNDSPSIFDAIQHQLGLKLSPEKAALAVIVIEHANRMPAQN